MAVERGQVEYVVARVGGAPFRVDIPMTTATMSALRDAQAGKRSQLTEQIKPMPAVNGAHVKGS
jgi:hypothetical protein